MGRSKELRKTVCEIGVLDMANGSALFQMGNAYVVAAIYGPRAKLQKISTQEDRVNIQCKYNKASFCLGKKKHQNKFNSQASQISLLIRKVLNEILVKDLLPETQIDIYMQVLQEDGNTYCACINAVILALSDAGVPFKDLICSCTAGYLQNTLVLDLNEEEEDLAVFCTSLTLERNKNNILFLQIENYDPSHNITEKNLKDLIFYASEGCKKVAIFMSNVLLKSTYKRSVLMGLTQYDSKYFENYI